MLKVQEFLSENSLDDLKERYAIKIKRHPYFQNLVHFSYDMLNSPLGEPIVQECRGLILDQDDNWKVVAFPYRKFFNYGEPHAAQIDWNSAQVFEKLDGTLIILYKYDGVWHVATTGTPDAGTNVNGFGFSFSDLFWRVWDGYRYPLPEGMDDYTFMFELMTPYNQVVVRQNGNRIVLHGMRNNHTLEEENPRLAAALFRYECVRSFDFHSIDEVVAAAEELDFQKQEGFVIVDAYYNRLKVKNPKYVFYHHIKSSFSIKKAVDIIRKGESAEFISYFPELAEMVHRIEQRYDELVHRANGLYELYKDIESDKEFARYALQHDVAHVLFALRHGKARSPQEFLKHVHMDAIMRLLQVQDLESQLLNLNTEDLS